MGHRYNNMSGIFTVPCGEGSDILQINYIGIQYVMLTSTVWDIFLRYCGIILREVIP
jgi:hypothetical protein